MPYFSSFPGQVCVGTFSFFSFLFLFLGCVLYFYIFLSFSLLLNSFLYFCFFLSSTGMDRWVGASRGAAGREIARAPAIRRLLRRSEKRELETMES